MAISVIKPPKQPSISVVKPASQGSISVNKAPTQSTLNVTRPNSTATIATPNQIAQNRASMSGALSATPAKDTFINNQLREFYRDPNSKNLIDKNTGKVISATEFGIGTANAGKGFKETSAPIATQATTQPMQANTQGTTQVQPTATPTAPPPINEDVTAYKQAYQNYIASLGETPAVTQARQKYTDYLANYLAGKNQLTGRAVETGNVPLGILRGQQERLSDQAIPELTRLEGAANMATQAQTAEQAKAKAGVDMAQSMLPSLQNVSGNIIKANPLTGQSEVVYSSPQQLSAGSSLIDPTTGKVLAQSEKAPGAQTASIQEYEYYANQEKQAGRVPKSYSEYQTEDANRKAILNSGGMSQQQINTFNQIANRYNASPLIAASDRTVVLKNAIDGIRKNPENGTLQLNLAYSYIQALDTYQSAVREGELALVNSIDSKSGQLKNFAQQMINGQIVRPDVAKQIANAAEQVVNTIDEAAKKKAQSYASQAQVSGVGDAWSQYTGGFTPGYENTPTQNSGLTDSWF